MLIDDDGLPVEGDPAIPGSTTKRPPTPGQTLMIQVQQMLPTMAARSAEISALTLTIKQNHQQTTALMELMLNRLGAAPSSAAPAPPTDGASSSVPFADGADEHAN